VKREEKMYRLRRYFKINPRRGYHFSSLFTLLYYLKFEWRSRQILICRAVKRLKQRPPRLGRPDFCGLAAAAVVVVTAAAQAVAVVVDAAEEQEHQNDDPPAAAVTPGTVVTHSHYLDKDLLRPSPYIPCYSAG
jgi:hypothetical protein